jgi:hypothetical protein
VLVVSVATAFAFAAVRDFVFGAGDTAVPGSQHPLQASAYGDLDSRAVPAKLIGTWTRKVTAADVKREHATDIATGDVSGTVWALTINKGGNASLAGVRYWTGPVRGAGLNRVHLDVGLRYPNVYNWQISRRSLTLKR